ncbi:cellulase family glycosylhydrolase [Streptomyces sp. NBC_01310]|uniref:cellulase family glycosylhydrolase n=1 Tax=unclassified Streptomyces TaxID=2593676 RepID=UPI0035B5B066|nr:cellulase family glycosylhydrolase [Streptomyces sp. NBC_01310]
MVGQSNKRQRVITAVISFVVATVATIVAASSPSPSASESTGGAGNGFQRPPEPPKEHDLRLGVSYGDTLTWKSDEGLEAALNDAVGLGTKWIRVDLAWNNIQPDTPNNYNWKRFDRVVTAARERNLEILATIAYTPAWARASSCSDARPSCPPADPKRFAAFAKLAALRYAPQGVHTWEIWNEPNLPQFWYPKPDAKAYTTLLKATAKSLREADPSAYLLMGGLAAVGTWEKIKYVSHVDFLEQVSVLGGNKVVDALSYHPYAWPQLPHDGKVFKEISSAGENLVGVAERHGTPGIPVWLTETGAPTNGPGNAAADEKSRAENITHVTEAFQARIATDTVPTAAQDKYVAAVFWFAHQDTATGEDKSHSKYYGLRRYDGSAKPAFATLRTAIEEYKKKHPK